MSRINAGLYSSNDQTWKTPPEVYEPLLNFLGLKMFNIDVCCSETNIPACRYITHPEYDALSLDWTMVSDDHHPVCWMNPPYGKALKLFLEKAYQESLKGCRVWALVPARTETLYQQEVGLTKAGFTVFLKGRLKFIGPNGESNGTAPFPTMLMYYGEDAPSIANRWLRNPPLKGTLMFPARH